jgi:hypothetical protein
MRGATLAAIALAGLVAPPCEVALAQDVAALVFANFGAGIRRRQKMRSMKRRRARLNKSRVSPRA